MIEATISYYTIRNGWKFWYWKNGLFYYKSIQDCQSYDLQNIGLKIHNFSLELKQSKTPPAASCWIISTLVRRYVFFNPRCCKSWDCPNTVIICASILRNDASIDDISGPEGKMCNFINYSTNAKFVKLLKNTF